MIYHVLILSGLVRLRESTKFIWNENRGEGDALKSWNESLVSESIRVTEPFLVQLQEFAFSKHYDDSHTFGALVTSHLVNRSMVLRDYGTE